jgi:hypothetical protein
MPAIVSKLGPGKLTVGTTPNDFSCQVTAARVEWEVDEGDDVVVLCGDTVPGARTYSAHLTATILSDLAKTPGPGIVEHSWTAKGTQETFVFVPSTAAAKQVTGSVILDPISVGGDESGQNMTSDFDWAIVGVPVIGVATLVAEDETPTGAKAGKAAA